MNKKIFLVLIFLSHRSFSDNMSDAISNLETHWNAFDELEKKKAQDKEDQFNKKWSAAQESSQLQLKENAEKEISILSNAITISLEEIQKNPNEKTTPDLMISLGKSYIKMGLINEQMGRDALEVYDKGRAILEEVIQKFPSYENKDQAYYQLAVLYETQKQFEKSRQIWDQLAQVTQDSLLKVHALLILGDHHFEAGRPQTAIEKYQMAEKTLSSLKESTDPYESVRISYRLMWANYRAAVLSNVIPHAKNLLRSNLPARSIDQREKIQNDAVEVLGDSLFELGNKKIIRDTVEDSSLSIFATKISHRVLFRYNANERHEALIEFGEFAIAQFSSSENYPVWCYWLSISYDKTKQADEHIRTLEKLAMLLPETSLWRAQNKNFPEKIQEMENLAKEASKMVGNYYYDQAMSSANVEHFSRAKDYYEVLVQRYPTDEASKKLRFRIANALFFTGNFKEADLSFEKLRTEIALDEELMELTLYQQVSLREKMWRSEFSKASLHDGNPVQSKEVKDSLERYVHTIQEYVYKFPGRSKTVDLILMAAGAGRDMEDYPMANKYWNQVLLSQPTISQRALAIRGMVYAEVKQNQAENINNLVTKFLRLENWKELPLALYTELNGILGRSMEEQGKNLQKLGKLTEAGNLLVETSKEFKQITGREKLLRDGAYYLAMASQWNLAKESCQYYRDEGFKNYLPDIFYLQARSLEYQMHFLDAVKLYLELAKNYPNHPRSSQSLDRVEKFAVGENRFDLAGIAKEMQGDRGKNPSEKENHYKVSLEHFERAEKYSDALRVAGKWEKQTRSRSDKYKSQIAYSRNLFKSGKEKEAISQWQGLSENILRDKNRVADEFPALYAEVNFNLAEEDERQFDDFDIFERSGNMDQNLNQKAQNFKKMNDRYQKVILTGEPNWSTHARYNLGEASTRFADSIASISVKSKQTYTLKAKRRFEEQVEKLRELSKQIHGANAFLKKKMDYAYRNNEWVEKSARKLGEADVKDKDYQRKDVTPYALKDELPLSY